MEMDRVWEKVKNGLREGAAQSREKIEEYTQIGKLKIEEIGKKRKIDRNYYDIGERVFDLISDKKGAEIEKDILVNNTIENIREIKKEIEGISDKIREIYENEKSSEKESKGKSEDIQGA